jgi:DNA-binding transcriptional ArsR family regulator
VPDAEGHPALEEMEIGTLFAALADPHRRKVVRDLIAEKDGVERTCASFGLDVSKSTLTHHFRVMREAGLLRQVNYGNSRKVTLRRADLEHRFPGLLDLVRTRQDVRDTDRPEASR